MHDIIQEEALEVLGQFMHESGGTPPDSRDIENMDLSDAVRARLHRMKVGKPIRPFTEEYEEEKSELRKDLAVLNADLAIHDRHVTHNDLGWVNYGHVAQVRKAKKLVQQALAALHEGDDER